VNVSVINEGDGYALSAALLIYTNTHRQHAFATKHDVSAIDGRPVIRPGTPFAEADYKVLVQALAPREQPQMRWRDPRVLAQGLGRTLWWTPPCKRAMFFKKSEQNPKTFEAFGTCSTPGLIFFCTGADLRVFAVKGRERPDASTRLYQAPFFNVWSSGQICVGSALRPTEDKRDDLDAWERMFFGSRFTHPNFSERDRLTVGIDPCEFWQAHLRREEQAFPESVLFDINLCVGDLVELDAIDRLCARPQAQGEF